MNIAAEIHRLDADVVLLQETPWTRASRFPLEDPLFAVLQPRVGFFESRVALGATAATPWGAATFFVAHLIDKAI
jgi:hypothetical protein